jgi:ADP-heptose:LPS heptosyltransferase
MGLPALRVPPEWTTQITSPDLLIVLNNRGSAQNLDVAGFLRYCQKEIQENQKVDFLVSGELASETETELKKQMGPIWSDNKFRIVREFSTLKEFCVYLSRCHRVCASSTGPLHLAHALGVSVKGFYPNSRTGLKSQSFRRWRPDGYWHQGSVEFVEF